MPPTDFHPALRRSGPNAAFTLVEIMIVVAIIGLLATIAIPMFLKIQRASRNNRFISDVRTFAQAFETYSLKNGTWPPITPPGTVPAGMSGELNESAWTTTKNSLGGQWVWTTGGTAAAAVGVVNITATDAEMTEIDAKFDDGDLTTGVFQKIGTRFYYILQR
jgi:prepilin-type N-terminal cleavage/methylation domain-containing protein